MIYRPSTFIIKASEWSFLIWVWRLTDWENDLLHRLHWNGFSPEWLYECLCNFEGEIKALPQNSHFHLNGFLGSATVFLDLLRILGEYFFNAKVFCNLGCNQLLDRRQISLKRLKCSTISLKVFVTFLI